MPLNEQLKQAIENYCQKHTAKHNVKWPTQRCTWVYEVNQKYVKVIRQHERNIADRSVHCFIQIEDDNESRNKWRSGDIFKPKSWAGPIKNFSRGNVFKNDYQIGIHGI